MTNKLTLLSVATLSTVGKYAALIALCVMIADTFRHIQQYPWSTYVLTCILAYAFMQLEGIFYDRLKEQLLAEED